MRHSTCGTARVPEEGPAAVDDLISACLVAEGARRPDMQSIITLLDLLKHDHEAEHTMELSV